jgi:hypothetical protein
LTDGFEASKTCEFESAPKRGLWGLHTGMQHRFEHSLYAGQRLVEAGRVISFSSVPWASVANEDSNQYMYDCDYGPVV